MKLLSLIAVTLLTGSTTLFSADPTPPAFPEIQAFADHQRVVIYWDKAAEKSIDPHTGYADFEGYRLFRSDDGGKTWGKLWDKVFDYSGNQVSWKPFAQFDYSEKQDTSRCLFKDAFDFEDGTPCYVASADSSVTRKLDVTGYDPLALWMNLGDNSGISRSIVDSTVIDGVEYTYAITAYDMGLRTYTLEFEPDLNADSTGNVFKADTLWNESNPLKFTGQNGGGYPSFSTPIFKESFSDYNSNGTWDDGEKFIDLNENCIFDYDGFCSNENFLTYESCIFAGHNWTGEYFIDENNNEIYDGGEPFIDENNNCTWDNRENPKNVINITPGYYASNVTFPDPDVEEEVADFISSRALNVGNGIESYRVVNTAELKDAIIKFEVNACINLEGYGDKNGSFATGCKRYEKEQGGETVKVCEDGCLELGPPSVYAYEVTDSLTLTPKETEVVSVSGLSIDSLHHYLGLPGAVPNADSSEVTLPVYIVNNHRLAYLDDPDYRANWTEWFNGVQFRFDNGPDFIPPGFNVVIRDIEVSDSTLLNRVSGRLRYKTNLDEYYSRPNYTYKIEFSNTVLDSAFAVAPASCNHQPEDGNGKQIYTPLPFKVTNLTLNQDVLLWHYDKGIEQGYVDFGEVYTGECGGCQPHEICIFGGCVPRTGEENCSWDYNEYLHFTDIVYSSDNPGGEEAKLFEFKLDMDWDEYAEFIAEKYEKLVPEIYALAGNPWATGNKYDTDELVYYEGMLYKTNTDIASSVNIPGIWVDTDGDKIDDNPWQKLYPWNDGDFAIIEPYKWYADGDSWIVDLSKLGQQHTVVDSTINKVKVIPNPYMVESRFEEPGGGNMLRFTHLPNQCTIKIYTVTGEFVTSISHDDSFDGNEYWDLKNDSGESIAPGLYLYTVETPNGEKMVDKFAVVR